MTRKLDQPIWPVKDKFYTRFINSTQRVEPKLNPKTRPRNTTTQMSSQTKPVNSARKLDTKIRTVNKSNKLDRKLVL